MKILEKKSNKTTLDELVINYCITEACNFNCAICYSKWSSENAAPTNTLSRQKKIISSIGKYFHPESKIELKKFLDWKHVRINFGGGEPLMDRHIDELVDYTRSLDMRVSLTTNGSLLSGDLIKRIAPGLSSIGFSIDSCNVDSLKRMGRVDRSGACFDVNMLKNVTKTLKVTNPEIKIKINTVVSSLNLHENMSALINEIKPDKWTVIQALPIINGKISIDDRQFSSFVDRHRKFGPNIESLNDYIESFILIAPNGRFFSNGTAIGTGCYKYSEEIDRVGVDKAFGGINFNWEKFLARYSFRRQ